MEYLPYFIPGRVQKVKAGQNTFNRVSFKMVNLFATGKIKLHLSDSENAFIKKPRNTEGGAVIHFNKYGNSSEDIHELVLHFSQTDSNDNVELFLPAKICFEYANKEHQISFNLLFELGPIESLFIPLSDQHG